MTVADIQTKSESWNMRVIGHHDLNGHGDGMQLLKQGRYVYVAHLGTSPMALSIVDAADPSEDFAAGQDTAKTRRPLGGFDPESTAESFGISPEATRMAIASREQLSSLMMAERVPGVSPLRPTK